MNRMTYRFRRFSFVLTCMLLFALASSMQKTTARASATNPLSHSTSAVQWIQQNAHPLQTTDQGHSDADLASLKQVVGNASIVGLGEETHGTHEIIDLKARLTEFLISKMGFTTFVMENSWGSSQVINNYINGGSEDVNNAMSDGLFPSWQTQEYRTLLEWMRTYNADPTHTHKIHFLGMDMQTVSPSDFSAVESYIQKVDPQQATYIQQRYSSISAFSNSLFASPVDQSGMSNKQQYQDQAQQVYDLLQTHQQAYVKHSSPQDFASALQTARIIVQFSTYYNYNTPDEQLNHYYQRDSFMANNVMWIHDHAAGNNPKLIVWAHDIHIANGTYSNGDKTMGNYLSKQYGNGYLPIGTTLFQGTFRTYQTTGGATTSDITAPASNTYNYTLGQTDVPLYMLDLRQLPSSTANTWATNPPTLNLYGLGGEDLSTMCRLNIWFDVIINIQSSTPAHPLSS